MGGGANQRASTAVADQAQATEQERARVRAPLGGRVGAPGPQALGGHVQVGINQRRVLPGMPQTPERHLAAVDPVAEHLEHRGPGPGTTPARPEAALVEPLGDRSTPLTVGDVPVEDISHDLGGRWVGGKTWRIRAAMVAIRVATDRPLPTTHLALHAGADALDDRGPLELGEDGRRRYHPSSR